MSSLKVLEIIRKNPKGIWIREIARKANLSPATVCNYLYGYKDNKGRFIPPTLKSHVVVIKLGNCSLTLVKPKS